MKRKLWIMLAVAALVMVVLCGTAAMADGEGATYAMQIITDKGTITGGSATISFNANGGTGSMSPVTVAESIYTLPDCLFDEPEGMVFAGWDLGQPNDQITITGNITLKAQWEEYIGYRIRVHGGYAADENGDVIRSAIIGQEIYIYGYKREGQYVSSWSSNDVSVSSIAYLNSVLGTMKINMPSRDITLEASWAKQQPFEVDLTEGLFYLGNSANLSVRQKNGAIHQSAAEEGNQEVDIDGDGTKDIQMIYWSNGGSNYQIIPLATYSAGSSFVLPNLNDTPYYPITFVTASYTVSFNTNGHGIALADQYVIANNLAREPEAPTEEGYAFCGWYKEPECINAFDFTNTAIRKDITLYAKWNRQYTVQFDARGHGQAPETQFILEGELVSQPENLTANGCVFGGWYTDTDFTYAHKYNFAAPVTENLTLYAWWGHTVQLDACGHGQSPETQLILEGKPVKQPENLTEEGLIFDGWYTDTDFISSHKYDFNTPVTNDITLYAWWGHTVDFDLNGNGTSHYAFSQKKVHEGSCATMPVLYTLRTADDTWQGWYIDGWYRENGCVNRFDFTQPVTANTTLYAHWVYDGYTVTYDWNGTHNVTRWKPVDGTYSDNESDAPVILKTRTGQPFREIVPLSYTGAVSGTIAFTGWYTEPECENLYDFSAAAAGDTTLYAGWAINYTVTRHYTNPYGGMASSFTYVIPYDGVPGEDSLLSYALENPPHYDGWVAAGYFTDEALTVPFDPDVPLTANVDIYIKWELASYTVTFDVNGGTGGNIIQTYHYGDAIVPPATLPTRTGYVCKGWSPYADATYTYGFANATCTGDASYYAVWVPEGVAINAANFPDETFRAYVGGSSIDTDRNGYLNVAERDAVTVMEIYSRGIANLKGIEYFTSLETLDCRSNALTSLDLSKNPALVTLKCGWNQIASLNLNQNTRLTTLSASNNALTSVNAVKCVNLSGTVSLYSNPDLTSVLLCAPGIKNLEIQFTNVTGIDLSGCPNLCRVLLEGWSGTGGDEPNTYTRHGLNIDGTNYYVHTNTDFSLDGLILSGIPIDEEHFPDAAFREFMSRTIFDRNQNGVLTENEISQITALSTYWAGSVSGLHSLQGVEYLTSVTGISLDDTGLSEIDLSQNPLITSVSLKNNELTSIDVSALSSLSTLNLNNNPGLHTITLGDVQVKTLRASDAPLLTNLNLFSQPRLLKTYLDGTQEQDGENVTYRYTWNAGLQTQSVTTLVLHKDATVALPEWEWNGTESAVLILPDGNRVNANIESEISADGKSITYTGTATVSGVPFTDSRTFCLVTFSGADVLVQVLSSGDYVTWPENPFRAGSVFEGWYLDPYYENPYYFGEPISDGFTIYAKWLTPEVSQFIKLPAAVRTVESEAFSGIPAQAVIVPKTVTSVAYDAFYLSDVEYIYGFPGTHAETFADTYGFTFIPIDDAWLASH